MKDQATQDKDSEFQPGPESTGKNSHWALMGKLISFQFKLAMDGIRDLLLSPVSIGFALYGIVTQRDQPDKYFQRLMQFGRNSDQFINLFGEYDDPEVRQSDITEIDREINLHPEETVNTKTRTSDDYVKKLEELVLNEYKKGGFITELKQGTDGILEKLQSRAEKTKQKGSDPH